MNLLIIWRLPLMILRWGKDITRAIDLLGAKWQLAALVAISGPKMSQFSGPTSSNCPRNVFAPHQKIITARTIKSTGSLIVIFSLAVHGIYVQYEINF